MTDLDLFDQRLTSAMRAYAGEIVPRDAAAVAARTLEGSRRPGSRSGWARGRFAGARLVLVGAVLTAMLGAVLLWAGQPAPVVVDPSPSGPRPSPSDPREPGIPDDLAGTWHASTEAFADPFTVDFHSESLVLNWYGDPIPRYGHAVSFERIDANNGTLLIDGPAPCGRALYQLRMIENRIWFIRDDEPCGDRANILVNENPWVLGPPRRPGPTGEPARDDGFSEPFSFIAYGLDGTLGPGKIQPDGPVEPPTDDIPNVLEVGNDFGSWDVHFFDDWPMNIDPCDDSATMPDIPARLSEVATWLSKPGVLSADPVLLDVDGRQAMRFDLNIEGCGDSPNHQPYAAEGYASHEIFPVVRIYAIPTGDDMIIAQVATDQGSSWHVMRNSDYLITSIDFD